MEEWTDCVRKCKTGGMDVVFPSFRYKATVPQLLALELHIYALVSLYVWYYLKYIYVAACKIKIHMLEYAYSYADTYTYSAYVSA